MQAKTTRILPLPRHVPTANCTIKAWDPAKTPTNTTINTIQHVNRLRGDWKTVYTCRWWASWISWNHRMKHIRRYRHRESKAPAVTMHITMWQLSSLTRGRNRSKESKYNLVFRRSKTCWRLRGAERWNLQTCIQLQVLPMLPFNNNKLSQLGNQVTKKTNKATSRWKMLRTLSNWSRLRFLVCNSYISQLIP